MGQTQQPSGNQPGTNLEELAQQAQREFQSGNYAAACSDFRRFAEADAASALAWSNYGVSCHMAGNTQEAVAALEKSLQLDQRTLAANLILGIDYIRLGRPREAVPLLKRVLDQQPDNRDALIDMATADLALHDFKAATDHFRTEISFRPRDADAWYGMGMSFEHIAEDASRNLASVAHESSYFHHLVGSYLLDQGLLLDAEDAFRKALAADSQDDSELRAEMGFALLRLHKLADADQEFHQEIALRPHSPLARLGIAALDVEKSNFPKATEAICGIHRNDPAFFTIHVSWLADSISEAAKSGMAQYLGSPQNTRACPSAAGLMVSQFREENVPGTNDDIFSPLLKNATTMASNTSLSAARAASEQGRYTECVEHLKSLPSKSLQGNLLLARCASRTGRFMVAFEAADAADLLSPSAPAVLYWKAESSRELAKAAFSRAVSLNPDSWQGKLLLGDLYRQRQQWDAAIARYSEAIQLKPELSAPHLGLAAVYWQNGQFDKAQPELQKVLQLDPGNTQAKSQLADILVRGHQFEQALPLLLQVAERNPDLLLTHANLAKVYAHEGKVDEAVKELLLALPSDSQGELHYQLYALYKKQGKTKEAQQALTESERLRTLALQQKQNRLKEATSTGDKGPE